MFLSNRAKIVLLIISLLFPIELWSQFVPNKEIEIHFVSDPKVRGEKVHLSDVAVIYAKKMQDFKILSNLVISTFSQGQSEIRMPQAYLVSRVQEAIGRADLGLSVKSADQLVFKRVNGIDFAQIADRILAQGRSESKFPEWANVEIESSAGSLEVITDALDSNWRIEAGMRKNLWRGNMNFRLVFENDPKKVVWVSARIRWFADALQAKRTIPIRSNLKEEDFSISRMEINTSADQPILGTDDLVKVLEGTRTKRSLQAGAPLLKSILEKSPDAKSGQALKVIFVSESGIRVSADGSLLSPAIIGEEARVKLRGSKKIVTGKLVNGQLMEVSL